jgi:hypothetical protein
MSVGIIIGMAAITVGSGVAQRIFNSLGKQDEASYLDLATKSGIAVTALSLFAKFISALGKLG